MHIIKFINTFGIYVFFFTLVKLFNILVYSLRLFGVILKLKAMWITKDALITFTPKRGNSCAIEP